MLPMQSGGREVVSLDESLKYLKVSAFKGHFPEVVSLENLLIEGGHPSWLREVISVG